MRIKEVRISFIQVEFLGALLRSRQAPSIPFSFLLSGPLFQGQYTQALANRGPVNAPWAWEGYALVFWRYYLGITRSPKQQWRTLVPLEYQLATSISPSWSGKAIARAYLYPWGIGSLVDVSLTGLWSFDDAVS